MSVLVVMNLKNIARSREIAADHMKGSGVSLYIIDTGRQNKNANVSMNSMVLRILKICNGLISFINMERIRGYKYNQKKFPST